MVEDRWYTVSDIAESLRVHEQTVRRWLRSGELAGYNFGGKTGYRIREEDLERFLETKFEGKEVAA